MLRLLNGSRLVEKIGTESHLEKANMLSVNQMNAQTKVTEVWKAVHDPTTLLE